MTWETVIGLEVHVQLATKSKLFSATSTAFGSEPNTQASAIDLAMPGTLPVANEEPFRYAIMFGLAIGAEIGKESVFERKNYFYPDLPKGYQTTQLAKPIVGAGEVEITLEDGSTKSIRIHHAHLEEDAGKSMHEDFHGMSGIDLNRAGTPLIEIVSEPDLRSAEEAVAFAKKLHSLVTSLGICDGEMSQGSMRFDVNISVHKPGTPFGTRTETKNLNSFKFMEEAIEMEVDRQIEELESGGVIDQETRLYDGDKRTAKTMRKKADENDYRYFPCPDLLPVVFDDAYVDAIKAAMPELPEARAARFKEEYQLSDYDADILSADAATSAYFEQLVKTSNDAKQSANWIMGELSAKLNAEEKSIKDSPVTAEQLGGVISRTQDGTISSKIAKQVFEALWDGKGTSADEIIESQGLKQVSDTGALEKMADEVIANSAKQVENYRNADPDKRPKMLGYFVGQIMKASKGQANPQAINKILIEKLNALL
ncbi:Asp-tRNA(Asn)/Glu-tRNA(Gln) amidotransferase subunit GatB [Sessilibacter corallicola]|uniref:Asp-tRNA(Asn)/Glu-tRNA(Gln) amidotransferase subunit GatB n=1 Tax=Sessilibacter corallicola TaxID=2904075 RepID=UPI001E5CE0ED|nr:Asp-tRNA(Asn)/Glu-tRNA(Gln) amidotransferase subunit GatB [Sessilibacter corallicola]MCE2027165.1 Asp-tRNA(Asn)/Glu-tRNA(Gln) amidotransferase subunit GatB [Sessilibacter corallicola]